MPCRSAYCQSLGTGGALKSGKRAGLRRHDGPFSPVATRRGGPRTVPFLLCMGLFSWFCVPTLRVRYTARRRTSCEAKAEYAVDPLGEVSNPASGRVNREASRGLD